MNDRVRAAYGDFPQRRITGPDEEGWYSWESHDENTFLPIFGQIRIRPIDATRATVSIGTRPGVGNIIGTVHGGFLLALVDQVLFLGPSACGVHVTSGVTVDVTAQFLAPAAIGPSLEAETEILRETGRFVFVRGLIRQGGEAKLSFTGSVRKPSTPRA